MASFPLTRVYRWTLPFNAPLAIAFVLLICSGLSGAWLFGQQRNAEGWVRHTLAVQNQLSEVQVESLRAALQVRSNVLSGKVGANIDIDAVRQRYLRQIGDLARLSPAADARLVTLMRRNQL